MWRAAGPAPGSRLPAYLATTPKRSADHVPAPGCVSDVVRAHCRRFQARDGCGWGGNSPRSCVQCAEAGAPCAVRKLGFCGPVLPDGQSDCGPGGGAGGRPALVCNTPQPPPPPEF